MDAQSQPDSTTVAAEKEARQKLAFYVWEYLLHVGAKETASSFVSEIKWEDISLGNSPGFLNSWWNNIRDLNGATPSRCEPVENCDNYVTDGARSEGMPGLPAGSSANDGQLTHAQTRFVPAQCTGPQMPVIQQVSAATSAQITGDQFGGQPRVNMPIPWNGAWDSTTRQLGPMRQRQRRRRGPADRPSTRPFARPSND
ncbi:single-stranded DNA-binding protein 2-like [Diprion similis]|uniref:single-stranded DNA-binding protein 2-like n=1 Tax=Diprion similis TaxID=362088 RepID=UPI001EF939FA|nr:single-stranded DNA-binding protein 2-like [Diprion similis]